MSDKSQTTILACPDCGGTHFSWELSQIQFGTIHRREDGQYIEEGHKRGHITGTDIDSNGVFCTTCEKRREREVLVPHDLEAE